MRQQFIVSLSLCATAMFMPGAFCQDSSVNVGSAPATTEAAPALTPEKKALIKELLVLTGAEKNVNKVFDALLDAQRKAYPKILQQFVDSETNLSAAQKKDILDHTQERSERALAHMKELFEKNIDLGSIVDNVSYEVYNKYFSADELKDIIAYTKTPTGQKALRVMPDLTKESMEQARIMMTPAIQKCIVQFVEEERGSLRTPTAVTK